MSQRHIPTQKLLKYLPRVYDSLNPLFCNIFTAVVACIRSLLLWSIKSNYDVDISVSCLRFTPRNHLKSPACRFSHWKTLYHSPMEISGNSHRKFSLIEWKAPLVLVNFGKCSSIRQCEFSEIQTRIFHRTESAIDFSLHDACFLNCFSH